jgi:hypothetical protein
MGLGLAGSSPLVPRSNLPFLFFLKFTGGLGGSMESSLFGWLVADGWCWFVLREKYCWLVADGWFVQREKYCWLVADKPNEQGAAVGGVGGGGLEPQPHRWIRACKDSSLCSFDLSATSQHTFILEPNSHEQPSSSTFLSEQIITSHQPNERAPYQQVLLFGDITL